MDAPLAIAQGAVAALHDLALERFAKGFPPSLTGVVGDLIGLSAEELPTPAMVLHRGALEHNVSLMAEYCATRGVWLAPHAKTTMAPYVLARQVAAGSWAMTVATIAQAATLRRFGVNRLFLANEIIDPASVRWLRDELSDDPDFEFFCLVDSEEGLRVLDRLPQGRVSALIELGHQAGRTGVRSVEKAVELAKRVSRSNQRLAGVEGYEGLLTDREPGRRQDRVNRFLDELARLAGQVTPMVEGAPCLVSAGGSAVFDLVITRLNSLPGTQLVLRSGCYVTHDLGWYEAISPLGERHAEGSRLLNAIEVLATVTSHPEPSFATADAGKRDVGSDMGLPCVRGKVLGGGRRRVVDPTPIVSTLSDQHTHLERAEALVVGDRIALGISHPCATFDRWSLIPILDGSDRVVDCAVTYF